MPYNPIRGNDLRPGTLATGWGFSAAKHDELYEDTVCHVAGSGNLNAISTTSTSYSAMPYLAFRLAKNLDNNVLRVKVLARTTDASNTALCTVKVVVDSTDVGIQSTTSDTGEWLTIDVTPTTATTDRQVTIYAKSSSGSYSAKLLAFNAYIVGGAPGAGVLTSDFISFDSTASAPSGAPIATEYVQRVSDGPIRIAKDRLLTLASVMDNGIAPRAEMTNSSSTFKVAYCGMVYLPDSGQRDYRISVYQGPPGSSPESRIRIGQIVQTFTGVGWQEATVSLSGSSTQNYAIPFQVELRDTTGSSTSGIGTVQIRRA